MSDTRDRMLDATESLIRQRGFAASSLSDILEAADAPRGSLYHHFPGGKDELVLEATRRSVDRLTRILEEVMEASGDPVAGMRAYVAGAARELRASAFGLGCPVASVVLDHPAADSPLAELCREALETWEAIYARHLEAAGLAREAARELATVIVASVEGAIIMARARRDTGPLEVVEERLAGAIGAALG